MLVGRKHVRTRRQPRPSTRRGPSPLPSQRPADWRHLLGPAEDSRTGAGEVRAASGAPGFPPVPSPPLPTVQAASAARVSPTVVGHRDGTGEVSVNGPVVPRWFARYRALLSCRCEGDERRRCYVRRRPPVDRVSSRPVATFANSAIEQPNAGSVRRGGGAGCRAGRTHRRSQAPSSHPSATLAPERRIAASPFHFTATTSYREA